ncbi:hypothetical protein TNCT_482461 [Trichonephila clavata]|uniref:Uncharacterized protein n=1 Tax=Trichonephila clavata TaxID=2740835 RepID=A0A8X6JKM9_TRICU|nr:hypothetical protein TNCT_482461 [Trichonephila clavata]
MVQLSATARQHKDNILLHRGTNLGQSSNLMPQWNVIGSLSMKHIAKQYQHKQKHRCHFNLLFPLTIRSCGCNKPSTTLVDLCRSEYSVALFHL